MTQLSSGLPVAAGTGFLFSPASRYPTPTAFLVDAGGTTLHSWSHRAWQPHPREEPPNYLRGWNHVAVDGAGSLYAIVPLRALLKLTFQSTVDWSCSVTAHHDLAFDSGGNILVLTEAPRRVRAGGRQQVVLDDLVTTIGPDGRWLREQSLYDILRTEPGLRRRIDAALVDRAAALEREWGTGSADRAMSAAAESWPAPGGDGGDQRRRTLQALRALPGSPCDVLHANTLDILGAHPDGSWDDGAVLVCLRELDTVAVLDLARAQVRWSWGAGELSGPHDQPRSVLDLVLRPDEPPGDHVGVGLQPLDDVDEFALDEIAQRHSSLLVCCVVVI